MLLHHFGIIRIFGYAGAELKTGGRCAVSETERKQDALANEMYRILSLWDSLQ